MLGQFQAECLVFLLLVRHVLEHIERDESWPKQPTGVVNIVVSLGGVETCALIAYKDYAASYEDMRLLIKVVFVINRLVGGLEKPPNG